MKWILAGATLVGVSILLYELDHKPNPNRLGKAISWSPSFPFPDAQASILWYGLVDVRGLASNKSGDLFLSAANGDVLVYSTRHEKNQKSNPIHTCPQEPCEKVDQRGIAISDTSIYVAEHGRGRLTVKAGAADLSEKESTPLEGAFEELRGPSGLGAVGTTLFITDDRPWPGTTADASYDSADYSRWLDKGTPRLFGALYTCTVDTKEERCKPALVGSRLRHPSGVVAVCPAGPVFVTEFDSAEVRWPIYNWNPQLQKWNQTGALGSIAASGEVLPTFLGITLDDAAHDYAAHHDTGHYVFAAGPGGLYVFDRKGGSLGSVIFDEPVTGVAYWEDDVYLIVGHMLCRLTIDQKVRDVLPQSIPDNCSPPSYLSPKLDGGQRPDGQPPPHQATAGQATPSQTRPNQPQPSQTRPSQPQPSQPPPNKTNNPPSLGGQVRGVVSPPPLPAPPLGTTQTPSNPLARTRGRCKCCGPARCQCQLKNQQSCQE
ncbi:MAG TPA: hypothetical protein VK335_14050 [Bryobacteraceae bacterium]|nr:hypothetical protein [Bryobacteraceae bacterium]HXR15474.1 hypothetical protein [Terriglobales bacterium]